MNISYKPDTMHKHTAHLDKCKLVEGIIEVLVSNSLCFLQVLHLPSEVALQIRDASLVLHNLLRVRRLVCLMRLLLRAELVTFLWMCMYVCMYIYVYMWCVCMYIYVCVYICIQSSQSKTTCLPRVIAAVRATDHVLAHVCVCVWIHTCIHIHVDTLWCVVCFVCLLLRMELITFLHACTHACMCWEQSLPRSCLPACMHACKYENRSILPSWGGWSHFERWKRHFPAQQAGTYVIKKSWTVSLRICGSCKRNTRHGNICCFTPNAHTSPRNLALYH